jgi:hypothetical protein
MCRLAGNAFSESLRTSVLGRSAMRDDEIVELAEMLDHVEVVRTGAIFLSEFWFRQVLPLVERLGVEAFFELGDVPTGACRECILTLFDRSPRMAGQELAATLACYPTAGHGMTQRLGCARMHRHRFSRLVDMLENIDGGNTRGPEAQFVSRSILGERMAGVRC